MAVTINRGMTIPFYNPGKTIRAGTAITINGRLGVAVADIVKGETGLLSIAGGCGIDENSRLRKFFDDRPYRIVRRT